MRHLRFKNFIATFALVALGACSWAVMAADPITLTTATGLAAATGGVFSQALAMDASMFMGMGGLIVTQPVLEALRKTFRQDFKDGFGMADHFWNDVAMKVMSSSGSNVYGWLGQFPQFREWVGDRVLKDLKEHSYEIVNRKFESSVEVGRDQIEDDSIGVYSPMFNEMGRATSVFPDELVAAIINNGEVGLGYDGQPFFDTEHPVFANVDGTGANTPASNVLGVGAEPAWYLLDTSRAIKPFIYQVRREAEFTAMTDKTDENVFTRDSYRWGVSLRAEAGYGLWQMAIKSTQPLTAANFEAARTLMRSFQADGGRPMGCKPSVLLCGTELEPAAERILETALVEGGNTNINKGKAKVISTEWLDA